MSKPFAPLSYVGKGAGRLLTGVARLSAHHMQQMLARAGWVLPVLPRGGEAADMGVNVRIWPSGALQKLIRESMRPFARQHGFAFIRRTVLGRVHEDTLHIICFDVPNPGFNCTVAVQPLYMPADVIVLSLGYRVDNYPVHLGKTRGLGDTEDEIRQDLAEVQALLAAHALPWFEQVGRPQGIITFIENLQRHPRPGLAFYPHLFYAYVGFSYLYLGKRWRGRRALGRAARALPDSGIGWDVEFRNLMDSMRALAVREPHAVPLRLQEYVRETKANLRLK